MTDTAPWDAKPRAASVRELEPLLQHYATALETERLESDRLREENAKLRAELRQRVAPSTVAQPTHQAAEFSAQVLEAIMARAGGSLDNVLARELMRYASERRTAQAPDDQIAAEILNGSDEE